MVPSSVREHAPRFTVIPLFMVALAFMAAAPSGPSPGLVPQDHPETAPVRPGLMEAPRESLSPRALEIRDFLEGRSLKVRSLITRYRAASDDAEAMRLMREIHDLKAGTPAELLKIQLRFAREDGNTDAVAVLQESLARMEAGPAAEPPKHRPRRDAQH